MESLIRPVAIGIELILLIAFLYCFLLGFKLILFDLGLNPKYKRFVMISLIIIGGMILSFLIAHLLTFYPQPLALNFKGG
ncbi:MAG: hypothetical protein ACUVTN_12180 [Thermodesulfobacteriota bacterium]